MNPLYQRIDNGLFKITLSKEMYEREAVFATTYKFSDQFSFRVEPEEPSHVAVFLKFKENIALQEEENAVCEFLNELLDQQLRLEIAHRTDSVRQRIYDEAFKPLVGVLKK